MTANNKAGQWWMGATVSGLLALATFFLGYWQGQRIQKAKDIQVMTMPVRQSVAMDHAFPVYGAPKLTPGVTPGMGKYQAASSKLAQPYAQMHSTNGAPISPQALAQFQQQREALLTRQQRLSQTTSPPQPRNPLAEPPPLQIPPNASPQQKTYLTARDQLVRDQIAFITAHKNDDPSTRQSAMQQWRQQNVARFQQLQQMAQALAQSNPASPSVNPSSVHP